MVSEETWDELVEGAITIGKLAIGGALAVAFFKAVMGGTLIEFVQALI